MYLSIVLDVTINLFDGDWPKCEKTLSLPPSHVHVKTTINKNTTNENNLKINSEVLLQLKI